MRKEELDALQECFVTSEQYDNEASKSTLTAYNRVTKMFIDWLPENVEISKKEIMMWKQHLLETFKPSTVQNYITITNKFIKFVYSESAAELKVKNIKIQQKASLSDVLEPIEFKRLCSWAKKLNREDMYLIMRIFAFTGIRVSELAFFTVENVEKNSMQVNNKGKTRNILLRSDLRREILRYCKKREITEGIIFHGKDKTKLLNQKTIWKNLQRIAGKARSIKKSKVHAHSFRHLFAIQFMEQHNNISELMDILGHTSMQTTSIYLRTTDQQKRKKLEKIKY